MFSDLGFKKTIFHLSIPHPQCAEQKGGLGRAKVGEGEEDTGKEDFQVQQYRRAGNLIIVTIGPQSLKGLDKIAFCGGWDNSIFYLLYVLRLFGQIIPLNPFRMPICQIRK